MTLIFHQNTWQKISFKYQKGWFKHSTDYLKQKLPTFDSQKLSTFDSQKMFEININT